MNARLAAVLASPALDPRSRSHLRLVRADRADAAFIAGLRNDPALNRHLNAPPSEVDGQLGWLEGYKAREAEGQEFYFVIMHEGRNKGLVRLYDFREVEGIESFGWGSWIIAPPSVPGLAIYSLLMALRIGYEVLGYEQAHFDVRLENDKCVGLYDRMGASTVAVLPPDKHLVLSRSQFELFENASSLAKAGHGRLFQAPAT